MKVINRFIAVFLALTVSLIALSSSSFGTPDEDESDLLLYTLSSDGSEYTVQANPKYRSTITEIVIPAEKDGIPVTTIAVSGFSEFQVLESVTVPDSIKTIKNRAFEECPALKSIIIPDSVTKLGEYAFNGCTSLESAVIGSGVTKIDTGSFYGCTSLKEVVFPDNLREIRREAFRYCSSLKSVSFPEGTETFGERCFAFCTSLTEIKLPTSTKSIGDYAFGYNNSSNGTYEGELIVAYFYGDKPNGINQAFGYTWDPDGFVVYVPEEFYNNYCNATASSDWMRCIVNTGKLEKFDISKNPYITK